jgi:hypothetical protein
MGFYNHKTSKLQLFNEANIVLLPKKEEAIQITDYWPISLINSLNKIITKILATRLAPRMNELVSQAHNAFIKKRCIHDNFLYAQRVIQTLHKKKKPALSRKWRNWISSILGSSSSRILVNGRPSRSINHAKGLRQGDPLSPLLFIIAIDPLQKILELAAQQGLIQPVLPRQAKLRCSLYADDAAFFANPSATELDRLCAILHTFGECSGLKVTHVKDRNLPDQNASSLDEYNCSELPGQD